MQPDPKLFLHGIRRELLETGNTTLAAGDFVKGVTMLRGGEVTAHMLLRTGELPALLSGFRPRQIALLQQSADTLRRFGLQVPGEVNATLSATSATDSEAAIAHYDALIAAQAQCLYALSHQPEAKAALTQLMRDTGALEDEVRAARNAALSAIRDADAAKATPAENIVPTDEIVTAHLRSQFPQYSEIRAVNVRQQKGVNTKEVFFMELHGHPDWPLNAVMRRNREVDTVGNEVSDEFGILNFVWRNDIPAPQPLFSGSALGEQRRSFVVMGRIEGRPQSAAELGASARGVLLNMARNLAALHRLNVDAMSDDYRIYGKRGTSAQQRTLNMIDRFYAMWQGDKCAHSIATESAYIWLRENVGMVDNARCVVHADYSMRNNLMHDGKISGILDWELAHEGHPGEDLGYIRLDVETVMPWAEFMQAYLAAGGVPVSDELVRYFRIYGIAFIMATLHAACNGFLTGKHSDMLIGAAGVIEYDHFEGMLGKLLQAEYELGT